MQPPCRDAVVNHSETFARYGWQCPWASDNKLCGLIGSLSGQGPSGLPVLIPHKEKYCMEWTHKMYKVYSFLTSHVTESFDI